jgi:hypothetical protein
MRWLLRLFRDPEPRVRVALAEAFAFFYRKEEAVVYRKYLALPHLIRMISDEDKLVRRAAARAIGESKRYEGVDPLLTLIGDPEESVSAEAVCSLGLIRDRRALATLQRVAQAPDTLPRVRAHSLIALQRLNSLTKQDLRQLVDSGLRSDDPRQVQRTLEMLDEIFGNSIHGVVLDRPADRSADRVGRLELRPRCRITKKDRYNVTAGRRRPHRSVISEVFARFRPDGTRGGVYRLAECRPCVARRSLRARSWRFLGSASHADAARVAT